MSVTSFRTTTANRNQDGTPKKEPGSSESELRSSFVAEPALLAQNLIRLLFYATIQDFIFEKVCEVNLQYPQATCDALLGSGGNTKKFTDEGKELQKYVGTIMMWRTVFETAFPIFFALVVGAWSDKYGRKYLMLFNLIGCLTESIALLICVHLKSSAGAWAVAVASSVLTSMTGGFFCYKMAVVNYVSDTTIVEQRTVRLQMLNSYLVGGKIIGLAIAGKFAHSSIGFGSKFAIIALGEVLLFAYVLIYIPNIRNGKVLKGDRVTLAMFRDIFDVKQAKDSIRAVFKKRDGNARKNLLLLLLSHCCVTAPILGELGVVYLFARYQFDWNSGDVAYFLTHKEIIQFLGSFVSTFLLAKYLKLSDNRIGIVACLNGLMTSLVMSNGRYLPFMIGPLLGIFRSAAVVIPRSKITKIIPSGEMGRVGSFIASLDCLNLLCSEVLYNSVYKWTFEWFPGAFYVLSAALMIPPSIVFRTI